jgi:predicted acetyltransferase
VIANLRLEKLSKQHEREFVRKAREYLDTGEPRNLQRYRLAITDFDRFLISLDAISDDQVAMHWYCLVMPSGEIMGVSRLRPQLTPELEQSGGHIGYDIFPSVRAKGYGTEILRLSLGELYKFGVAQALLTVAPENLASIQVIRKNGGDLRTGIAEQEGMLRFLCTTMGTVDI